MTRLDAYRYLLFSGGKLTIPSQKLRDFVAPLEDQYGEETINTCINSFEKNVKAKWAAANRTRETFEQRNSGWLQQKLIGPILPVVFTHTPSTSKVGAPTQQKFSNLSESQKRKRTAEVRKDERNTSSQLLYAAKQRLKKSNRADAAAVLDLVIAGKSSELLESFKAQNKLAVTNEAALGMVSEGHFSVRQYNLVRNTVNHVVPKTLPSYYSLLDAKEECYPSNLMFAETEAIAPLQTLLEKTASRLLQSLPADTVQTNCTLLCKWGFDGSGSHSQYKQLFSDPSASDSSVVITTMVPIRMISDTDGATVWDNITPSSPNFCRPIRMAFQKESKDNICAENLRVDQEIASLSSSTINLPSNQVCMNSEQFCKNIVLV